MSGAPNWWSHLGKPQPQAKKPSNGDPIAPAEKLSPALEGHPWPHPPAPSPRIPRIIHHVWPGLDVFPTARAWHRAGVGKARFHEWRLSWMRLHPDWSHMFHRLEPTGHAALDALLARTDLSPVVKADVLRWGAVARRGGIYVDTDFQAHASFEPLLGDAQGFFIAYEPEPHMRAAPWHPVPLHPGDLPHNPDGRPSLSPALFGGEPGHPFAVAMLERLLARVAAMDPRLLNERPELHTGPGFTKTVARDFRNITLHPCGFFYPEVVGEGDVRYATHHWTGHRTHGGWVGERDKWR